jgi:hypothetical protein
MRCTYEIDGKKIISIELMLKVLSDLKRDILIKKILIDEKKFVNFNEDKAVIGSSK